MRGHVRAASMPGRAVRAKCRRHVRSAIVQAQPNLRLDDAEPNSVADSTTLMDRNHSFAGERSDATPSITLPSRVQPKQAGNQRVQAQQDVRGSISRASFRGAKKCQTHHRRTQRAFTLVELMVVIAILGVLAAIAVPQYQTYVAKSQVTRVVAELGAIRTPIELCILEGKKDAHECAPIFAGSNLLQAIGNTSEDLSIGNPQLVFLPDGRVLLTGTFGGSAAASLRKRVVIWLRNQDSSWTCMSDVDTGLKSANCTQSPPKQGE